MSALLFNIFLLATEGSGSGSSFTEFFNHYLNYPGFEAWRFFNLAIFIAIMVYLLRKPLSGAFKAKRETIRAELIKAEEEKQAALAQLTSTEAKLARLDAETQTIRQRSAQEAAGEKTRIDDQTEFEIGKMREQANAEIEGNSKRVQADLRKFSAEESIRLAEEKIKRAINAEKDAKLVKAGIQSIGGLN